MLSFHRLVLVVLVTVIALFLCSTASARSPRLSRVESTGVAVKDGNSNSYMASPAHASIIGGSSVSSAAYPWLAFIEGEEPNETFYCTGTVVAPRVVLTAGHCVMNLETGSLVPESDFAVATGSANLNALQPANVSLVSQTVLYPGFTPSTLAGDAGLLILSNPTSAPAIPLASYSDAELLRPGTGINIAGWGRTSPNANGITANLQAASTVVQGSRYCRGQVGRYYPFFSAASQLCAVDPPSYSATTCHGDSGGPAIADSGGTPIEIGITSLGDANCSTTYPDVFTRVDVVSTWVTRWIEVVEGSAPAPASSVPNLRLPRLTIGQARHYVALALRGDFRYRYQRGRSKRTRCRQIEREKVKCGVSWFQGPNDYYGTITIYYLRGRETLFWSDRYRIHWVNDYCWYRSGHRRLCRIHTRAQ